MMNDIILSSISLDALEQRISKRIINEIKNSYNLKDSPSNEDDEFITLKKTASIIGVSKTTIHKWKKVGKLKAYYFNTRVRFKKSEILKYCETTKKRGVSL